MTSTAGIACGVAALIGAYTVSAVRVIEDATSTAGATDWERIIGNLGIPVAFMVFMAVLVLKLLPHLIEWVKGQSEMSKAVVQAMPNIARLSPEEIGRVLRQVITEARQLDTKLLEGIDTRLDALVDRISQK